MNKKLQKAKQVAKQVSVFNSDMLDKILSDKNLSKVDWRTENTAHLYNLLEGEMFELREAIINGNMNDIIAKCADVANFSMMIADKNRLRRFHE